MSTLNITRISEAPSKTPFAFPDRCRKCLVPMAIFPALQIQLCKNRECIEYSKQVRGINPKAKALAGLPS